MAIELWNTYHLITLAALAVVTLILGLILKGKDQSVQKKVLLTIAFINLAIHFLKLLLPEYKELMPSSIALVTFDSITAALIIMMPFVLLSKNSIMKDFIFYMGVISAIFAFVYPLEVLGRELSEYDVIRYYLNNLFIFIPAFYMVFFGHHGLDLKRVLVFPLVFLVVQCLILANEVILMETGLLQFRGSSFLDYNYRNNTYIFGPAEEFADIHDKVVEPLIPKVFKTVKGGIYDGSEKYLPVAWMIVPSFVYLVAAGGLLCLLITKVFKKSGSGF